MEWAKFEDAASRMEEGRKVVLDQLTLELVEKGESVSKAERIARTSAKFKNYLRSMHESRKIANELKIEMENKNRAYWEQVSIEAQNRAEMKMSR